MGSLMEDAGPREEVGPAPVHDADEESSVVNLEEWRNSRAVGLGASAARLPVHDGRETGGCLSTHQPETVRRGNAHRAKLK